MELSINENPVFIHNSVVLWNLKQFTSPVACIIRIRILAHLYVVCIMSGIKPDIIQYVSYLIKPEIIHSDKTVFFFRINASTCISANKADIIMCYLNQHSPHVICVSLTRSTTSSD